MVRHESFWLLYDNATLENWSYLFVVSLSDGWLWRHSCCKHVSRGPRRREQLPTSQSYTGSQTDITTEYQLHWLSRDHDGHVISLQPIRCIDIMNWCLWSDDVDSCHLLRSATHAQCMIRIYIRQYHTRLLSYTIASSATGLPPYHCLSY